MKNLKIAILLIAVIASVTGALASKKRGGQFFYLRAGESATGLAPVITAVDQEQAPGLYCTGGNDAYICRIMTTNNAPSYVPGDAIPRTDLIVVEYYSGF
ncbi:hypothetical protein HNQ91_005340 [Filimonas zeae]|uniref:Uncharacterized protein n=1 Tax=Filimonas zeae TaxID=1737353 RepID=A0A917J3K3_9BACT|nr:hypothetical protein [Filimonas zeae]MDR6342256.1 hypothetical protein [Filimonas zeae]GGH80614.1 hypothetical protein GCM10011379_51740 [Filimonas zeae]